MSGRPWSTSDERTLREHYPTYGPAWDGWKLLLPGRSAAAIANHAAIMGVTSNSRHGNVREGKDWTPEQRGALLRCVTRMTIECDHDLRECMLELTRLLRIGSNRHS